MTQDYHDHIEQPREDTRENDEEENIVTQKDIDLAERDLEDRETDFSDAYRKLNAARIEVIKARDNVKALKANLGKPTF